MSRDHAAIAPPFTERAGDLRSGLRAVRDALLDLRRRAAAVDVAVDDRRLAASFTRIARQLEDAEAALAERRLGPVAAVDARADLGRILAAVADGMPAGAGAVWIRCPPALRVSLAAADLALLLRALLMGMSPGTGSMAIEVTIDGGAAVIDLRGRPNGDDPLLDRIVGRMLRIGGGSITTDDHGVRVRLPLVHGDLAAATEAPPAPVAG